MENPRTCIYLHLKVALHWWHNYFDYYVTRFEQPSDPQPPPLKGMTLPHHTIHVMSYIYHFTHVEETIICMCS